MRKEAQFTDNGNRSARSKQEFFYNTDNERK